MMRILTIIFLALVLTGCGGGKTLVVEETHIVVQPPEGLWNCPDVQAPSEVHKQSEVADYVLRLYEAHQVCKAAIEDVKKYLEQAQQIVKKVEK